MTPSFIQPDTPSRVQVLVLIEDDETHKHVVDGLPPTAAVETDPSLVSALGTEIDLCLVGSRTLDSLASRLADRRQAVGPERAPCLLVDPDPSAEPSDVVDDVLRCPIEPAILRRRVNTLLRFRWVARTRAEQRDRIAAVGDWVAHDLRSAITAAAGYVDVARETGEDEHFRKATTAIDRMEDIVARFTTLVEYETASPSVSTIDLEEAVRAAWTEVDSSHLALRVGGPLGTIEADPDWLVALLKAAYEVAAESQAEADRTLSVTRLPDRRGFVLIDEGPPPAESPFGPLNGDSPLDSESPFALRLAIVRRVADAHGWDVALRAAETGTRVAFAGLE